MGKNLTSIFTLASRGRPSAAYLNLMLAGVGSPWQSTGSKLKENQIYIMCATLILRIQVALIKGGITELKIWKLV